MSTIKKDTRLLVFTGFIKNFFSILYIIISPQLLIKLKSFNIVVTYNCKNSLVFYLATNRFKAFFVLKNGINKTSFYNTLLQWYFPIQLILS